MLKNITTQNWDNYFFFSVVFYITMSILSFYTKNRKGIIKCVTCLFFIFGNLSFGQDETDEPLNQQEVDNLIKEYHNLKISDKNETFILSEISINETNPDQKLQYSDLLIERSESRVCGFDDFKQQFTARYLRLGCIRKYRISFDLGKIHRRSKLLYD